MKRRRIIEICSAIVVIFALLAVAFWPRQKEPEYEGLKLSWWLAAPLEPWSGERKPYRVALGREAIRAIGTNGLPYMLKAIAYETPSWRTNLPQIVYRIPMLGPYLIGERSEFNAEATVWGFEVLGRDARSAIPELGRILRRTPRPITQGRAARALAGIGEDGLDELIAALHDPQTKMNDFIIVGAFQAARRGVGVRKAVPVLLATMDDHESGLMARSALIELSTRDPAVYLPVLTEHLHHTNEVIRAAAATVLTINTNTDATVRIDAEGFLALANPALVYRLWPERVTGGRKGTTALFK